MNPSWRRRPSTAIVYLLMVVLGGLLSIPVFHEIEISIKAHAEERLKQLRALEP